MLDLIVGERMHDVATSRPLDEQRTARLEARLALYSQYAALVADEMAAAWSADPDRAGRRTREIARVRAELAEHYDELRAPEAPGADGFRGVLAEMVTELDQQAALDRALRAQVETLRRLALPGANESSDTSSDTHSDTSSDTSADTSADTDPVHAAIGGALVAARTAGVGGALGGQYPGVSSGADASVYVGADGAAEREGARLDVRF